MSSTLLGQPWTCESTGETQYIIFENIENIIIDDKPIELGDVIGVFFEYEQERWECIGELKIRDLQEQKILETHGVLFSNLTIQEVLNKVEFRIWDKSKNCVTVVTDEHLQFDAQSVFDSIDSQTIIEKLKGETVNIRYPKQVICKGEPSITPELMLNESDVTFLTDNNLPLSIDPSTGFIDVSNSQPGSYRIEMESNYCLEQDFIDIEIIEEPEIIIPDPICAYPVQLTLDNPEGEIVWNDLWVKSSYTVKAAEDVHVTINNKGCFFEQSVSIDFVRLENSAYSVTHREAKCNEKGAILVDFTNENYVENGTFIAGSHLLTPGVFEPIDKGVYQLVYLYDNGCVDSLATTFIVNAPSAPNISTLTYETSPVVCEEKGSITLHTDSISGKGPFTFILDGIEYEDATIEGLDNAFYNLEVVDTNGCSSYYNSSIEVTKLGCNENYFYPDLDGASVSSFFKIDTPGLTKIYNREGVEMRTLTTPTEWDGRNNQGELVPMGEYYIVTNEETAKTITVFR